MRPLVQHVQGMQKKLIGRDFQSRKLVRAEERLLSKAEFQVLASVPAEAEWFANITNPNTRRAYKNDVNGFMRFVGIGKPEEFREVKRPHVIAWRDLLVQEGLAPATIRRKLSALSDLFSYLCDKNAILEHPVNGVRRPKEGANEGKTPALSNEQVRLLLSAPDRETLRGFRDRAILSVLAFHGPRRFEVAHLRVKDMHSREGVMHFHFRGKGSKNRYVPVHPATLPVIGKYLEAARHGEDRDGPMFRPINNNRGKVLRKCLSPDAIYGILRRYSEEVGIGDGEVSPHALRATAATNALENKSDLKRVRDWLGHSNVSTTTMYDKRGMRPEDSPTFNVEY